MLSTVKMVYAVLSICYSDASMLCENKQLQIEQRFCAIGDIHAKVQRTGILTSGGWANVTIQILCKDPVPDPPRGKR